MELMNRLARIVSIIVLLTASGLFSFAGERRIASFDLKKHGFPRGREANPDKCAAPFTYYRAVRWLEQNQVLVAFNTSPLCPKDEHLYPLPSTMRLASFDLHGNLLHSTDISYLADLDANRRNDLIWTGPGSTVLVQIKSIPKGRLIVFTKELKFIQEIETEYADLEFEGVTPDGLTVIFSTGPLVSTRRTCLAFQGVPLRKIGHCDLQLLQDTIGQFEDIKRFEVPKSERATLLNCAESSNRCLVFSIPDGPAICQLAGLFCPHGYLNIFQNIHTIVERVAFPVYGRAYLSPDGMRFATFIGDRIEIFELPAH